MNGTTQTSGPVELSGIDGANPLGFLAALGTLACLHAAGYTRARLAWHRRTAFRPLLYDLPGLQPEALSEILATQLAGRPVSRDAEERRNAAQKNMDRVSAAIKKKREEIKRRGLNKAARDAARAAEVFPLEQEYQLKRREWLATLRDAVPREELALGRLLDCTPDLFRSFALDFLADASLTARDPLDMLAAFGSDGCTEDKQGGQQISATPFYFTRGSGQQYFLDTIRQLTGKVTTESIKNTLFSSWQYSDVKLSMRWDPIEDRQYALLAADPAEGRTEWMANLLGYRGLAFFPSVATLAGLRATAWFGPDSEPNFTWPLWEMPLPPDSIRSVLSLRELVTENPDRGLLRALGICVVYRARRIRVGMGANCKYNFSPSRAV